MVKLERYFQRELVEEIRRMIQDSIILKMDPGTGNIPQGFPDLLILHNNKWASLEVKKNAKADKRPNQEYYVGKMNEMSFSRFIYPENKEEVLNELCATLKS